MEAKDVRVTVAVNYLCLNKTRMKGEHENWNNIQTTIGELHEGVVRKGAAFNASLFRGGYRNAENAFGGDTIVIDEDEGIDPELIKQLPVFQEFGVAIWPSASSGVVSEKPGVDGRFKSRVLFKVGRQFNTEKPKTAAALERVSMHAERIACSEYIYDRFTKELGIEAIKDLCGKTVGQLMYGCDGKTPVEWQQPNGEMGTYPCSSHTWVHFNDGCMPVELMEEVISRFREEQGERLQPKQRRSSEENAEDYDLALWILDNDILSEDVLTDREMWVKAGMACRGISDDLMEPFLETSSRFDDGHYWRSWDYMHRNWYRFSEVSAIGIGTLIQMADESTDRQWRYLCPYFGSKSNKIHLSSCFALLRSHKPGTPGFNNFQIQDF